jgi:hypothetical protein
MNPGRFEACPFFIKLYAFLLVTAESAIDQAPPKAPLT